jgi:hypothetical protein
MKMSKTLLMLFTASALTLTACGDKEDKKDGKEEAKGPALCDCVKDESVKGCDELKQKWEKEYEAADEAKKEKMMEEVMACVPEMEMDEETDSEESGLPADCESLVALYEVFIDELLTITKEYQAKPDDTELLAKYTELSAKGAEITTALSECAADPAYADKIAELSKKMAGM